MHWERMGKSLDFDNLVDLGKSLSKQKYLQPTKLGMVSKLINSNIIWPIRDRVWGDKILSDCNNPTKSFSSGNDQLSAKAVNSNLPFVTSTGCDIIANFGKKEKKKGEIRFVGS